MTKQYNERDDVREEPRPDMANTPEPIEEQEPIEQEPPQASDEKSKSAGRASGSNDTRETRRTRATRSGDAATRQPRAPRKRSAKPRGGEETSEPAAGTGSIIQMPRRENRKNRDNPDMVAESDTDAAIHELEAQGFTADEAIRLVHVSDRAATSGEAREAEATLRRLRFTRWLVERGMLDEFSA